MNFSLYIARRYLISKNGRNAINIINRLSFFITIIGTTALFIVLSGFSGLKEYSTSFSNYFDPDLKILPYEGKTLEFTLSRKRALQQINGIENLSATIEEKVFLSYEDKNDIAYIKGVDDAYSTIINTDSIMLFGSWLTESDPQIVMGSAIATNLSVSLSSYGSYVNIMVPRPGKGAINELNLSRSFKTLEAIPSGLFSVDVEDIDSKYIFSRITAVRTLLEYEENEVSAIELKLAQNADESFIRNEIEQLFEVPVIVKNKFELNDALYKMLNSENIAVYLIFTLVLIIALFNVIGSIIMTILDKKKNLKTLLDLGAEVGQLRKIFFLQGAIMTSVGGIIGITLGSIFVYTQITYEYIAIAPGIPYPFAYSMINVLISFLTIVILGTLASYIGSQRINDRLLVQAKL